LLHGSVASPHNPLAHFAKGQLLRAMVRCREAIPLEEQAIRLSPRNSDIGLWYFRIGQVHLLQSRIDEATAWLEKARPTLALASAYALKGETERGTRLQPGAASGFQGKRDHSTRSNRDHGHHRF
jgi:tetratricopeptide (TPR) repeat protein